VRRLRSLSDAVDDLGMADRSPRRALIALLLVAVVVVSGVASGSAASAAAKVRLPPAGGVFDYQIGGAYAPSAKVQIVDRDRTSKPVKGRYNVCYVNALQTQSDEPGQSKKHPPYGTTSWWKRHHPTLLVHDKSGHVVVDPDWDEAILNVATTAKRTALLSIQKAWVKSCRTKGFQAVEPDNQDSYARSHRAFGFAADRAYLTRFTRYAHAEGLAVAQKNANGEFGSTGRTHVHFDFAIAEECSYYDECASYTSVYGRRVIDIEYTDEPKSAFLNSCSVRGSRISVLRRDRDVVPRGAHGYSYTLCP
jgi:hypothetical protein